jgi:RNA polymerase sigma factor (sigma-70 family)
MEGISGAFLRLAQEERVVLIEIAGEHCTPRQRQVLLLHYGHDVPLADIAQGFGVSRAAVTQAHKRALAQMRVALVEILGITGLHEI